MCCNNHSSIPSGGVLNRPMTAVAPPPQLRVWENFCGKQQREFRRYRRATSHQDDWEVPREATCSLRRHWSQQTDQQVSRTKSDEPEAKSSPTEISQFSVTSLVQHKSTLLHPVRKCVKRQLEQEAQTIQYVLQFSKMDAMKFWGF